MCMRRSKWSFTCGPLLETEAQLPASLVLAKKDQDGAVLLCSFGMSAEASAKAGAAQDWVLDDRELHSARLATVQDQARPSDLAQLAERLRTSRPGPSASYPLVRSRLATALKEFRGQFT